MLNKPLIGILALSVATLILAIVLVYRKKEGYAALSADSTIITSKTNLPQNDPSKTNASNNVFQVYALKDNQTVLPMVTTVKGWNDVTGQQDVLCNPSITTDTFPPNYYQIVNSDAQCKVAPDVTGATDGASFNPVDPATGRVYLKQETDIASKLRSGSGVSCSNQYKMKYGDKLMKDEAGMFYKFGHTDPSCLTTPDTTYYSGPTAVDINTIAGSQTYM